MNDFSFLTHVDDGEHVLEGGVGQQEEEGAVDVHNSGLVNFLVQINDTQNKSNHLKPERKIAH